VRAQAVLVLMRAGTEVRPAYYWTQDGRKPFTGAAPGDSPFVWFSKKLSEDGAVVLSSVDDLPEEAGVEKELLRRHGRQSSATVMLKAGGSDLGILSISSGRAGVHGRMIWFNDCAWGERSSPTPWSASAGKSMLPNCGTNWLMSAG
jgi:hypothetical protein